MRDHQGINKNTMTRYDLIETGITAGQEFIYFRKNFGYFYGIRKTLPNFFKAVRLYLFLN